MCVSVCTPQLRSEFSECKNHEPEQSERLVGKTAVTLPSFTIVGINHSSVAVLKLSIKKNLLHSYGVIL